MESVESQAGSVQVRVERGIAVLEFFHPKKNSLPGALLARLAEEVRRVGADPGAKVAVLRSRGDGPFCAGASFDELTAVDTPEGGMEFFMGFARLILAMRDCPKFIVARVQGKTVGGGVGLAAAADYALALHGASIKLSELDLGIGPFVVGPAVERKIGFGAFAAMSIDTGWRSAAWACERGLFAETFQSVHDLDRAVDDLARRLSEASPEAMARLKKALWKGAEDWDRLLEERAAISGGLVLSEFTRRAIAKFKQS